MLHVTIEESIRWRDRELERPMAKNEVNRTRKGCDEKKEEKVKTGRIEIVVFLNLRDWNI